MPLNKDIKKVLVIGSGPIVIGQAAEFDYAGTQACRALKEDNIEIVLINSNPATIMTDNAMADKIYIEPLTLTTVKRIIEKEKPDSVLSSLGGQTGLTLSMQLAKDGFLKKHNVKLLGAKPSTIDKAEDRLIFKDTMKKINQPCIPSETTTSLNEAVKIARQIGYPVIVRPAFTLGGTGGGIAENEIEFKEIAANGIALSPINQILVEKCISGWKEIEFEVIRDSAGNAITVCSMENFDPVGVHTGDSIVVAPALTLSDKEFQMLRSAALKIVEELGVEGGCNVQFALEPNSFDYTVIEVNPRVSRSSALASKATGYPIAKVATKLAIGYTLDEIENAVTGCTYAAFEPSIDYVALKFPKWPFDKFFYAKRELGTQMKATGEVMSIADSFEAALLKAVRGVEISLDTLNLPKLNPLTKEELLERLKKVTDERIFVVFEALKKGVSAKEINSITKLDMWFLSRLENLLNYEHSILGKLDRELYIKGKKLGYTDAALERLSGCSVPFKMKPVYKMVDTCAGEFDAHTPYFYSIFETDEAGAENEALPFIERNKKETVIVIGSGPIRIGQGIEFDYASVHCAWSLKKLGYNVVIINNNPETVSTDFDTSDRLYFEPLTPEAVLNIIEIEKPIGVVVSFGGQTAIKLAKTFAKHNIPIIGSSFDSIDMAEDRERFDKLLEANSIKRPKGHGVLDEEEALKVANELGYPVLMRPSYVIGGQNMVIAFNDEDLKQFIKVIFDIKQDCPVLIDKYISGMEIEVDAICDGEEILMPGIMEHIEMTGVHSGDSIAVYPAINIDDNLAKRIEEVTKQLCLGLNSKGLVNLQYIVKDGEIYVIEVNPRASRTVPYISKVSQLPMCDIATKVALGMKLRDLGYGTGYYKPSPYIAVKVPIFSFEKLTDVDTQLGPEMKSTGEVLGMGKNLEEALYKGLIASGYKMVKKGGVFIAVKDIDKPKIAELAKKFDKLGFKLYATAGTAEVIKRLGLKVNIVQKIHENNKNILSLFNNGLIQYIISTSARGSNPARDSFKIRRRAVQLGIPCLTSIDTANALADSLLSRYSDISTELIDINNLRQGKLELPFIKMQSSGNDYIYLDLSDIDVNSPESLSIFLADRNYGIGADGVVVLKKSKIADYMMRMFNLDGSEGKMSGNAAACVAKYLYDKGIVNKLKMQIETASGIRAVSLVTKNNLVIRATVEMGTPEFEPEKIPVNLEGGPIIDQLVEFGDDTFAINCMSLGNPHCVIFMDNIESINVKEIGSKIENNLKLFPDRVNVAFVQVNGVNSLRARIWERGNGETLSSGTSACAAAVAAVLNGHCKKGEDITVELRGGKLIINVTDEMIKMTCTPIKVFEGVVEI